MIPIRLGKIHLSRVAETVTANTEVLDTHPFLVVPNLSAIGLLSAINYLAPVIKSLLIPQSVACLRMTI